MITVIFEPTNIGGYSGYSGISGISGYSGILGNVGTSGYSGIIGISGYSGIDGTGISGYSGISGISGYSGIDGVVGISGYSGISGISGYSGIEGTTGISGYSGMSGYSGYSGISGYSGYSGYSGIRLQTGFINKNEDSTIYFDEDGSVGPQSTPRTFYIYGTYALVVLGIEINKSTTFTTADYVQISAVTGLHIIYYNTAGNLQSTTAAFDPKTYFFNNAIVSFVYWNSVDQKGIVVEDERHGKDITWETHWYLHEHFHTQYDYGLGLNNITADGNEDLDASAQFGVDDGGVTDEDLEFDIIDDNPQDLTFPAQIPIFYRSGATSWRRKEADSFPLIYSE